MDKKDQSEYIIEVIEFIEKLNNIKLYNYQKIMLEAIIKGYTFSVPRRCGRKVIIDGYYEFLKSKHSKHLSVDEADVNITFKDVLRDGDKSFDISDNNINDFKMEYEFKWINNPSQ